MKAAVIVFPGSNCDRDLAVAIEGATGVRPHMVWHTETELPEGVGAVAVPGGFSYGDYLRSGAVAAITGGPARALEATQGLLFNLLHKGHVLDPLGVTPNQRNVVMSALAAAVALTALFGIALRRRATRHRETV